MTSFIIIALLITVASLALIIWPLRKNRHSISYARQAQNIHFAKERLQELEGQLKNASISATDYEALKLEIESTLADDIDIANNNVSEQEVQSPKSNLLLISALCLLMPVAAVGIYTVAGTPESFSLAQQAKEKPSNAEVNSLLADIEQRLKESPNDIKGWTILSRSYLSLGRYQEAKRGFKKLLSLEGESAALLTTLADTSGLAAGGIMAGEPLAYAKRALELDPQYPQALWMAGLGEIQVGNTTSAIAYWTKLDPLLEDSPLQQQELRDLIAQANQETPSTTNEPLEDVTKATDAVSETGIQVTISLDPALKSKVSPSDRVFIFAKAVQGPPAPLAVKRITVADLPITIRLSDADAMVPQFKLSLFENVSISARIAKAGNPIAQAGDLESEKVAVKNNTTDTVKVIISSEVK